MKGSIEESRNKRDAGEIFRDFRCLGEEVELPEIG
jgi:hypothetical protein